MVTDLLTSSKYWDLTLPVTPPRSRLYSLEPVGIGTSGVESLTGYIARLANAHYVPVGSLIADELESLGSQTQKHSYLHQINGCTEVLNSTGQMASDFVRVLESLTLRQDLYYLTLVQWANVLPVKGLLRRTRVWCSACYEEQKRNKQTVYEPLLWSFSVVSICQYHQQRLSSKCPFCQRQLPHLSWHSRPGHCSKCHQWLGSRDLVPIWGLDSIELEWQTWTIKNVGELLASSSCISEVPERERVARAFSLCISQTTQGNIAEFARNLGLLKSAVWQWQSSKAVPQLSALLKICQALGVPLLDFLCQPEILDTKGSSAKTLQGASQSSQHSSIKFDVSKVQQDLQEALLEEQPSSMEAVAKKVQVSSRSLRRRFPKLCSAISDRYLSQREKVRLAKVEQYCIEVRQIALELYNEGIDPTRSYISRYLSKPAYFREPLVEAALMAVRKELGLEKS